MTILNLKTPVNFFARLTLLILSHYTIYSHVYTENIAPPIGEGKIKNTRFK